MTSSTLSPSSPALPAAPGVGTGLLLLLGLLIGFAPLAIDMYLPALPAIGAELHAGSGAVQATLAAYLAGMAGGQLVYGMLADRFGRRAPLLAGLAIFALASLGCAQAASVAELAAWRLVQALGGCAGVVMPLTIVADRVRSDADTARVMSRLMAVIGLAPVIAPTLGGGVQALAGWRAIFVVLAMLGVAAWVLVWRVLPETLPAEARRQPSRGWGEVLRGHARLLGQRGFVAPALAGAMAMSGMFAYISASAFVMIEHHGLSPLAYSGVFAANAAAMVLGSQLNARLLRRHAPAWILRRALPALTAAGGVLALLGGFAPGALWPLLAGLAAFLGLLGFVTANTSALAMSGHARQQRGTASGLLGTLQFSCGAAAGAALSLSGQTGPLALGLAMAACAALAWGASSLRPAA